MMASQSEVERLSAISFNEQNKKAQEKKILITSGPQYDRLINIANRLIPQTAYFRDDTQKWNWQLSLINSPVLNATCAPGGKITFYTGIIDQLKLSDDEIAAITKRYQPKLEVFQERIDTLAQGVQTYCEANRNSLTNDGKVKSANFVTGEVNWRIRPPSIAIRGADSVIKTLERMGLSRFVRTKKEPNKEAMLNEADAVRGIAGISVVKGVEDFVITPFEANAEEA
jgi:phage host-nuclease inhibitor protein Gam